MTAQELQALVREALATVREMDAGTRKLALDSGVLDRHVAKAVLQDDARGVVAGSAA